MVEHGVILFYTTSAAFAAEKTLAKGGVGCALVPVPREFSSDCGVALRFGWDLESEVARILDVASEEVARIHRLGVKRSDYDI